DQGLIALTPHRPLADVGATARARRAVHADEIIGSVADQGSDRIVEGGHHKLTDLAVGNRPVGSWAQALDKHHAFPQVVAVMLAAFPGCAGITSTGVHEQLHTPFLPDPRLHPGAHRLTRKGNAGEAGEQVLEVVLILEMSQLGHDRAEELAIRRPVLLDDLQDLVPVAHPRVDRQRYRPEQPVLPVDLAPKRGRIAQAVVARPYTDVPKWSGVAGVESRAPLPLVGEEGGVTGGPRA